MIVPPQMLSGIVEYYLKALYFSIDFCRIYNLHSSIVMSSHYTKSTLYCTTNHQPGMWFFSFTQYPSPWTNGSCGL